MLKGVEFKDIVVNSDKTEVRLEVISPDESVIASPNSAPQEEERIPRVIVTSSVPGVIATSSVLQMQKLQYQSGSGLGGVEQEAISPTDITQEESEPVPRVIVT